MIGIRKIIYTMLCLLVSGAANADDFIDWHTSNIQLLRGYNYELGDDTRTIITLEHANGWRYGDFYGFADITTDARNNNIYAELSPRFSLGKITGEDLSYGIVKDVLISTTFERGNDSLFRYLVGFAVDLNLPGFKFFKTNFYIRDDDSLEGNTYQSTISWNLPVEYHGRNFLFEGFADITGAEGSTRTSNQLIVPRFLVDVSKDLKLNDGTLFAGIEWQYWHNKFGIDGVTESVPQLQLKLVF